MILVVTDIFFDHLVDIVVRDTSWELGAFVTLIPLKNYLLGLLNLRLVNAPNIFIVILRLSLAAWSPTILAHLLEPALIMILKWTSFLLWLVLSYSHKLFVDVAFMFLRIIYFIFTALIILLICYKWWLQLDLVILSRRLDNLMLLRLVLLLINQNMRRS